jgi:hypothetical protein
MTFFSGNSTADRAQFRLLSGRRAGQLVREFAV